MRQINPDNVFYYLMNLYKFAGFSDHPGNTVYFAASVLGIYY